MIIHVINQKLLTDYAQLYFDYLMGCMGVVSDMGFLFTASLSLLSIILSISVATAFAESSSSDVWFPIIRLITPRMILMAPNMMDIHRLCFPSLELTSLDSCTLWISSLFLEAISLMLD